MSTGSKKVIHQNTTFMLHSLMWDGKSKAITNEMNEIQCIYVQHYIFK